MLEVSQPLHRNINQDDVYAIVEQVLRDLSNEAIDDLAQGSQGDIEKVIDLLVRETTDVLASGTRSLQKEVFAVDSFSESVEETLRCRSMNYFTLTVLPEFIMGWHNIQWSDLIQIHRLLCILAARDHGKCMVPGTKVVMSNGSIKNIEDIIIGDSVMGPDGSPRKVLQVHSGNDNMYRIHQTNNGGEDYVVNSRHLLHLEQDETKWAKTYYKKTGETKRINISPLEYLSLSNERKHQTFGVRVNGWDLPETSVPIDPYLLGMWLGDGEANGNLFSSIDSIMIDIWRSFVVDDLEMEFVQVNNCDYRIRCIKGKEKVHKWTRILKESNLFRNKHIPEIYFQSSRKQRMELLAGIIDTDGNYEKQNNRFAFAFKHSTLADDVVRLALSLGFKARKRDQIVKLNYRKDEDYLREEVIITGDIWTIPVKLERKKPIIRERKHNVYRHRIEISEEGLGEYFGITVDGDNLFILRDGTITHNSYHFSFAYPLWQMYRFRPKGVYEGVKIPTEFTMSGEGMLVTNEYKLASELMSKVKAEIEVNDILKARLMPDSKREGWGAEKIVGRNGATFYVRSANSKIRGLHPKWIVLDDFLNESSLYSQDMRNKYWNIFSGVIYPALSPGGQLLIVGTPFFEKDLYGTLKEKKNLMPKDESFQIFEYPAIFPDGTLLFPERHSLQSILQKRALLGSLIFSREILVTPIADSASLFPYSILNNSIRGQQNVCVITNIDSSPRKYAKIVVGCDFAISAETKADHSVFTILGVDELGLFHILNSVRLHGAAYGQQIAVLKKINRDFRPDIMYAEDNGMQQIFIQLMMDSNLPVVGKTTGSTNKKSLYHGVPSLAVLFETGRIKFPYGDEKSRTLTDLYFSELNSITYIQDKGKLESTSQHDDTSMSLWQAVKAAKGGIDDFDFHFLQ